MMMMMTMNVRVINQKQFDKYDYKFGLFGFERGGGGGGGLSIFLVIDTRCFVLLH